MKNLKRLSVVLIVLTITNTALAEGNGKELLEKLCVSCHATSGKPTIAPPVFAVVNHVRSAHTEKQDFVNYHCCPVNFHQKDI